MAEKKICYLTSMDYYIFIHELASTGKLGITKISKTEFDLVWYKEELKAIDFEFLRDNGIEPSRITARENELEVLICIEMKTS